MRSGREDGSSSPPGLGGTRKWVPVRKHRTFPDALAHLRTSGFRVLAAHPAPQALDFRAVDYTLPTAILLGTEETGVSEEAAAAADGWIAIPMAGMVTSLNVSVAAALVLFEAQRQREAAGLYASSRLPPTPTPALSSNGPIRSSRRIAGEKRWRIHRWEPMGRSWGRSRGRRE